MSSLIENTYFAGRYKLVNRLGSGGFSVVWLAEDTMAGDTLVALKIYAPDKGLDKDGIDNFRKEYAITLNLNHSSLLSTKHFDVSEGSPYLIMQYMPNGSALKLIENIDEKRLSKFIYEVASGLEYLHANEPAIIHQDIKPDNVLISGKGDFLLTDFGISTRVRRTLTKSAGNVGYSGTIAYVPPERYMRNPRPQPEGDIFAFGIMLFEMMTGYLPWNEQGGLGFIGSQIIPPIDVAGFSDTLKDLTTACISFKPEDRPTASEISIFAQSYVRQGFWDPQFMPNSVKIVAELTLQQASEQAAEALKQEAIETEKRKVREVKEAKELADEKIRVANERKRIEKENVDEAVKKKKEDEYKKLVTEADEKFEKGNYHSARESYNATIKLKDDKYTKDQLDKCNIQIKEEQSLKQQKEKEDFLQKQLNQADNAFNSSSYKLSKKYYQLVLSKDAGNTHSQNRLKEIETLRAINKIETRRKSIKLLIPLLAIAIIAAGGWWFLSQPVYPIANFTANNLTIRVGETVKFSSTSSNANELSWQFTDGVPSSSNSTNQDVKFNKPGVYSVSLSVSNDDGNDSKHAENYITVVEKEVTPVIPLPTADFVANSTSVLAGNSISFSNKSENADRIEWTFEDGKPGNSKELNPTVNYINPGTFKVTLTAYNQSGKKIKSRNNYITVSKDIKKTVARFESDTTTIYVGGQVQFYDLSSFVDNRNWEFTGGEPQQSNERNPIVSYSKVGSYSVQLEVANKKGKDRLVSSNHIIVLEDPEIIAANKFKEIVVVADGLYKNEFYNKALQKYEVALDIIPNNNHVITRIADINSRFDTNGSYDKLISEADNQFNNNKYDNARSYYNKALKLKGDEKYPQEMLNKITRILSDDNVAFEINRTNQKNGRQILVSSTGYTAVVRVSVDDVYKNNKIKLNISTEWKDKKGRTVNNDDEQIALLKSNVTVSSNKVHVENFDNTDFIAFSNRASLKIRTDKSFTGGDIEISLDLVMFVKETVSGIPVTLNYSSKNPAGNLKIKFELDKYYKSKY